MIGNPITSRSSQVHGRTERGIKAIRLTIDILEQLCAKPEVGISELSIRLRSSKPTIYRHLRTLLDRGYAVQNPLNSRYRLGIGSYLLGQAAADRIDLISAASHPMRQLIADTGHTAVLSSVSADSVVVVQTMLGSSSVEIGVRSGSALAHHATAQGKVALAFGSKSEPLALKAPLRRFTRFTIVDRGQLEREIARIQARGWAAAAEEFMLGLNSVAAPICAVDGRCIATLAIVGSIQFIPRHPAVAQTQAVVKAANAISRSLGLRQAI